MTPCCTVPYQNYITIESAVLRAVTEFAEIYRKFRSGTCETLIESFKKKSFTAARKFFEVELQIATFEKSPHYLNIRTDVTISHHEIFCGRKFIPIWAEELRLQAILLFFYVTNRRQKIKGSGIFTRHGPKE